MPILLTLVFCRKDSASLLSRKLGGATTATAFLAQSLSSTSTGVAAQKIADMPSLRAGVFTLKLAYLFHRPNPSGRPRRNKYCVEAE